MIEAANTITTTSKDRATIRMADGETNRLNPPARGGIGSKNDSALIEFCNEFIVLENKILAMVSPKETYESGERRAAQQRPLLKKQRALLQKISSVKATTPAGHNARARAAVAWWPELLDTTVEPDGHHMVILQAMLRDMLSAK